MSEHLHPDPDSLNAFLEGVLPEHQRLQCLGHLAECSRCREIVFMAQEAAPVPVTANPTRAWRRWFAPVPALVAAAAVLIAALGLSLYLRPKKVQPEIVARVTTSPASTPEIRPEAQVPQQVAPGGSAKRRTKQKSARPTQESPPSAGQAATTDTITPPSPPAPPPIPDRPALPTEVAPPIPQAAPTTIEIAKDTRADGLAGISGSVTDPTGAFVPRASVTIRQISGPFHSETRADANGQFTFSGLAAGRYELHIASPGFRVTALQIDVEPRQMASVRPELSVGSVSETVEVTAASPTLQTESSSVARTAKRRRNASPPEPRPLPSNLPADLTVTNGKTLLAMDSAGAVFVSRNSGKSWRTVKPVWQGTVDTIRLADSPQTSKATFELATDSGAIWLSRDGSRWYAARPER